jgi:hypothetical protein
MGVNRPSVQASDLTIAGKFVTHATSPEKKSQERGVEEGDRGDIDRKRGEIGSTLEKYTE